MTRLYAEREIRNVLCTLRNAYPYEDIIVFEISLVHSVRCTVLVLRYMKKDVVILGTLYTLYSKCKFLEKAQLRFLFLLLR
jgi:hypothetical protein